MNKKIGDLRGKIDKIDLDISDLLVARFGLVKEIGKIKKKEELPIEDQKREIEIINKLSKVLPRKFVKGLFENIFSESKRIQNDLN